MFPFCTYYAAGVTAKPRPSLGLGSNHFRLNRVWSFTGWFSPWGVVAMILLKPSATIEAMPEGKQILETIERAARTCYKSEPQGDPAGFVRKLLNMKHESTIEHVSATVRFVVDRGVSHELVRHRLASFSQESTRYCDYTREDKSQGHCQFIIPPWCSLEPGVYDQCRRSEDDGWDFKRDGEWIWSRAKKPPEWSVALDYWLFAMSEAETKYKALRQQGWSPQQARSVLPNSTKTEIVVTANLREWRHILRLRTSKAAHPQMQEVMIPLLSEFKQRVPVLFEDIRTEA